MLFVGARGQWTYGEQWHKCGESLTWKQFVIQVLNGFFISLRAAMRETDYGYSCCYGVVGSCEMK